MGALTPIFLLATVGIAVPLWLHLFHRHQARRISFPALRYLERTERDHARRIKVRQLLLLVVRVAVLLMVVGAGARLFFMGRGTAHPPTALVIVLDNSMSSGLVVGEERVLDRLKARALQSLDAATADDRIWILRAGEPWIPAVPGGAIEARALVEATEVSAGPGDLASALRRSRELLSTASQEAKEIHLLSDLQATAFDDSPLPTGLELPIVAWADGARATENHAIVDVLIGGGLPPLEGQRSELAVRTGSGSPDDTVGFPVRVVIDGRIRGAATVPSGSATAVTLPSLGSGWVQGWVESDADALRADDRRHFAFRSRPAPVVRVEGDAPLFLTESLGVLREAGRLRTGLGGAAELIVAVNGTGTDRLGAGGAALVVPPADPALLPGLNRRLSDAGIPWRYAASGQAGEAPVEGTRLPDALQGITVRRRYTLTLEPDPPAATSALARVASQPWLVEGEAPGGGRYLLLGSALDAESSTLPVSTAMIRFLDWSASQWAGQGSGTVSRVAGLPISAPRSADHVRLPGGSVVEIDGTRTVRATGTAGFYTFLTGDSTIAVEAVNPPAAESQLATIDPDDLEALLGGNVVVVEDANRWSRAAFRTRQGPELWWALLLAALVLLAAEALLAASGRAPKSAPTSDRVLAGQTRNG